MPRPFQQGETKPLPDGIKKRLRDNSTNGLIVVRDGAVVGQYFRYGFAIDDVHLVHSS